MKRSAYLILLLCLGLLSCQKELHFDSPIVTNPDGPGNPLDGVGDIQGNWKFLYLDLNVKTISETSGSPITTTEMYKAQTINNSGTIAIDANNIKGTGIAYTVDTEISVEMQGMDLMKNPLNLSVSPYGFTSSYSKITADSLYFESGFIIDIPNAPVQNPAAGTRFELRKDTLILSLADGLQQTINQGGGTSNLTQDVKAKVYLKRQ